MQLILLNQSRKQMSALPAVEVVAMGTEKSPSQREMDSKATQKIDSGLDNIIFRIRAIFLKQCKSVYFVQPGVYGRNWRK